MMALSLLCHDSVSFVVHRSPRIVSRYTRSILLLASRDCGKPQSKGAGIPQQDASPNLPVLEYRKRLRIFVIQMFLKLWKGCEDILRWNISDNYIVDEEDRRLIISEDSSWDLLFHRSLSRLIISQDRSRDLLIISENRSRDKSAGHKNNNDNNNCLIFGESLCQCILISADHQFLTPAFSDQFIPRQLLDLVSFIFIWSLIIVFLFNSFKILNQPILNNLFLCHTWVENVYCIIRGVL